MKKTESIRGRLFRRGGVVAGLAALAGLAVVGSAAASTHAPAASQHPSGAPAHDRAGARGLG
jgi:hypothetical protein